MGLPLRLRVASLAERHNSSPIEEFNLSIRLLFKKKRYICDVKLRKECNLLEMSVG